MRRYHIALDPARHLYRVTLTIEAASLRSAELYFASWTPGSYVIRDYAGRIRNVSAAADGIALPIEPANTSAWHIDTTDLEADTLVDIHYDVFAFSLGIHDAYLDEERGFFNGPALYAFLSEDIGKNKLPHEVVFSTPGYRLFTTLASTAEGRYCAPSLEVLLDSPVALSAEHSPNAHAFTSIVNGTPHHILITGVRSINIARVKRDLEKIFETTISFWDAKKHQAPFEQYLLQLHLSPKCYGGLEHAEGCVLLHDVNALPAENEEKIPKDYNEFLTLAAHEYFHAWLVKRLRPAAFVNYDLRKKAFTTDLWLFEGFTSFFESVIVLEAGLIEESNWRVLFAERLNAALSREGFSMQSLADSSYRAWTKLYKQTPDSPYSQVSYYSKGALCALIIDEALKAASDGQWTLKRVLSAWYLSEKEPLLAGLYTGLQNNSFADIVQQFSGIDIRALIDTLVHAEKRLNENVALVFWRSMLDEALKSRGLKLIPSEKTPPSERLAGICANRAGEHGGPLLGYVPSDSPAFSCGLYMDDELIAIDREAAALDTLNRQIERAAGRIVAVHWFREGRLHEASLDLTKPAAESFTQRLEQKVVGLEDKPSEQDDQSKSDA